jgi:hypothetical protein
MGNIEGTGLDTVTAADAPLLVDNDHLSLVRYGSGRTYLFTTGFSAVHTGVFPMAPLVTFFQGKQSTPTIPLQLGRFI